MRRDTARRPTRRRRRGPLVVVVLLVLAVTVIAVIRTPGRETSAPAAGAPAGATPPAPAVSGPATPGPTGTRRVSRSPVAPREAPPRERRAGGGALGVEDGEVPDGVSVFDTRYPAVTALDPDLLAALREAGTEAAHDGVEIDVNSGWRSAAYQQHLLDRAVVTYGSATEAARWVATPETSAHVSGDAVDVAPTAASDWLATHGSRYGLCQVYDNEPWHYELRPAARDRGCPRTYADPADDPRLRG